MEVADKLYDLAMTYWDLQSHNYDIEFNHEELLDCDFSDPDLMGTLDSIIARANKIRNDKPPSEPEVDDIFRQGSAPVPNNSVINVVTRSMMSGGNDFESKPGGWEWRKGTLIYEESFEKAGKITISIKDCENPEALVRRLNVFTLDVLIGIIGHIALDHCEVKPENSLLLKSAVSARQILRYKGISSYGKKRWDLLEKVSEEMESLRKFNIQVKGGLKPNGKNRGNNEGIAVNHKGSLIQANPLKRDFNPHTKLYVVTSWEVQPGQWAAYDLSKEYNRFLGKLDRALMKYDHRQQRTIHVFAKKLMYSLFVVPGGTIYLKKGARKHLKGYLQLIGEYYEGEDVDRKKNGRSLKRLGKAVDFLVEQGMVTTDVTGSLFEFIDKQRGPWEMRRLLHTKVEIHMTPTN